MRIKLIIFKIILSLFFISSNAIAKNLPPGSGISDVPANVLILLDKSGSMSARMTSGQSLSYPMAMTYDTSGNLYVASSNSIKKFNYATGNVDTSWGNSGSYQNYNWTQCYTYSIYDMKVHNGFLYVGSYRHVYRINLTTGACDTMSRRISAWYPKTLNIKNNHLYFGDNNGFYITISQVHQQEFTQLINTT